MNFYRIIYDELYLLGLGDGVLGEFFLSVLSTLLGVCIALLPFLLCLAIFWQLIRRR